LPASHLWYQGELLQVERKKQMQEESGQEQAALHVPIVIGLKTQEVVNSTEPHQRDYIESSGSKRTL
jgi:hypothetical protein